MDNKLKIKEALKKKLRQEMSMTGTGASVTPGTGEGVATKYAFGKSTGGGIPKDWKAAPSIPNRPSKAMDYKKIFEGELKPGVKYNYKGESGFISTGGSSDPKNWKFLGDKGKYPYLAVKTDLVPSERQPGKYDGAFDLGIGKGHYIDETEKTTDKIHIGTNTKTDSDIYFEPSTGTFSINIIDPAGNRTNKLQVNTIDDVLAKFPNWKWTEQGKAEFSDALNEGYARFRNETKTRTKPEQFHQAVKEVKKKVNEINRLFEYMDRLKSELNEGEELKYKKYTEKSIQQIKESTKQLFFKSTKLK